MSKNFSERLIYLRSSRKKAEFARELGIPAPMYHRYENGQIPQYDNLKVIADKTGTTVDWLLTGNPDINQHAPPQDIVSDPAVEYRLSQPLHHLSAKERVAQYASVAYDAAQSQKKCGQFETLMQHISGVITADDSYDWHRREISNIIDEHSRKGKS